MLVLKLSLPVHQFPLIESTKLKVKLSKSSPSGKISLIVTFSASIGPMFPVVTFQSTISSTSHVALLTVLLISRSVGPTLRTVILLITL